jgi:hypothetical protein
LGSLAGRARGEALELGGDLGVVLGLGLLLGLALGLALGDACSLLGVVLGLLGGGLLLLGARAGRLGGAAAEPERHGEGEAPPGGCGHERGEPDPKARLAWGADRISLATGGFAAAEAEGEGEGEAQAAEQQAEGEQDELGGDVELVDRHGEGEDTRTA